MKKGRQRGAKEAVQPSCARREVHELAQKPMWVLLEHRTSLTARDVWFSTGLMLSSHARSNRAHFFLMELMRRQTYVCQAEMIHLN